MKKVIYTVLVGNYDQLKQPSVVDDTFDYLCFSNDIKEKRVGVWVIRGIDYQNKDKTRISRYAKLLPHRVLSEYDYSLYIDANIQITGSELYQVINSKIEEGALICQVPNIFRDCIYKDIEIAYRRRKVDFYGAKRQYRHLKAEQFPEHYGLLENNVILRKHNDPQVVEISEAWWKEYCEYTHRDQFCLMFVYWKQNLIPDYLFGEGKNARNVECLNLIQHPRKRISFMKNENLWKKYEEGISLYRKYIWKFFK